MDKWTWKVQCPVQKADQTFENKPCLCIFSCFYVFGPDIAMQ